MILKACYERPSCRYVRWSLNLRWDGINTYLSDKNGCTLKSHLGRPPYPKKISKASVRWEIVLWNDMHSYRPTSLFHMSAIESISKYNFGLLPDDVIRAVTACWVRLPYSGDNPVLAVVILAIYIIGHIYAFSFSKYTICRRMHNLNRLSMLIAQKSDDTDAPYDFQYWQCLTAAWKCRLWYLQ